MSLFLSPLRPGARATILVAMIVATACGRGSGDDSDGTPPVRRGHMDVVIGGIDGSGPEVFGRVSGLAVDDGGRIYVSDVHAHEIRVFDADGEHLFTFGRRGGGPGELDAPCCLAFGPDGLLWVRDNGNARYAAFDVREHGAVPAGTERMRHGDVNRFAATTFDEQGRLIDVGMRRDPATGQAVPVRHHIRPGGDVELEVREPTPADPDALTHRVTTQSGSQRTIRYFYQPYGPLHVVASGPTGMHADVVTSSYEVRWYDSDGSLRHVIERPGAQGPALTAQQRERADSMIASHERSAGSPMPFSAPARHPPIAGLHFDRAGRLWVQRTSLPGDAILFDVYDGDGRLAERIELPAGADLRQGVLDGDQVVGIVRDGLGVDHVARFRLEQAEQP